MIELNGLGLTLAFITLLFGGFIYLMTPKEDKGITLVGLIIMLLIAYFGVPWINDFAINNIKIVWG